MSRERKGITAQMWGFSLEETHGDTCRRYSNPCTHLQNKAYQAWIYFRVYYSTTKKTPVLVRLDQREQTTLGTNDNKHQLTIKFTTFFFFNLLFTLHSGYSLKSLTSHGIFIGSEFNQLIMISLFLKHRYYCLVTFLEIHSLHTCIRIYFFIAINIFKMYSSLKYCLNYRTYSMWTVAGQTPPCCSHLLFILPCFQMLVSPLKATRQVTVLRSSWSCTNC